MFAPNLKLKANKWLHHGVLKGSSESEKSNTPLLSISQTYDHSRNPLRYTSRMKIIIYSNLSRVNKFGMGNPDFKKI